MTHRFTVSASLFLVSIIVCAQQASARIPISVSTPPPPSRVDNRTSPSFPEVINQIGESCASASSIGYIFNYELNVAKNAPYSDESNRYPYAAVYSFLNDGSSSNGTYDMFIDAWKIVAENGTVNDTAYGEADAEATKWPSGYEHYQEGMSNRVAEIDSLDLRNTQTLDTMRQWLFDHGNGSPAGGTFLFTASMFAILETTLEEGPEAGNHVIHSFGTDPFMGAHSLTIVGYDDSIRYDWNQDGLFTTDVDINGDDIVDLRDREKGAFICANTWGKSYMDSGFFYAPYRLFFTACDSGGTMSKRVYFITVRTDYRPLFAFRVRITHSRRNSIAISIGINPDTAAQAPQYIRQSRQFRYAGGALPMCGKGKSDYIEIGLDATDLIDSIGSPDEAATAAWFAIVDAKSAGGECTGVELFDCESGYSWSCDNDERALVAGTNIFRTVAPIVSVTAPKPLRYKSDRSPTICAGGNIRIDLELSDTHISLFRIDGACIAQTTLPGHGSDHSVTSHHFGRLSAGCYVVQIAQRNGRVRYKRFAVADR